MHETGICCIQKDVSPEEQTCTTPAGRGHLTCLQTALLKGFRLNSNATAAAARGGHLMCLGILLQQHCRVSVTALVGAAVHDHLECLQRLCHRKYPFKDKEDVCSLTCHGGSLRCLKYLHRNGYCLSANCYIAAASAGKLSCMQYLLAQSCPWDGLVMFSAAQSGHFDCLCFAYENGCPWWDQDDEFDKVSISSLQCVLFVEKYCPMPVDFVVSTSTDMLLRKIQTRRAVGLWCLTKGCLPVSLQQVILQHADLLCTASCTPREEPGSA